MLGSAFALSVPAAQAFPLSPYCICSCLLLSVFSLLSRSPNLFDRLASDTFLCFLALRKSLPRSHKQHDCSNHVTPTSHCSVKVSRVNLTHMACLLGLWFVIKNRKECAYQRDHLPGLFHSQTTFLLSIDLRLSHSVFEVILLIYLLNALSAFRLH